MSEQVKEKSDATTMRIDGDEQGKATESKAEAGKTGEPRLEDLPLPKVTFSTFVMSLASSALVQLGEVPDPADGRQAENLLLAKHTIDIISMLQEKIQKGLDDDEQRLLDGILYELRMKYVIKSS